MYWPHPLWFQEGYPHAVLVPLADIQWHSQLSVRLSSLPGASGRVSLSAPVGGGVKCHVTVRGGVKSHVTVRGGVKSHVTVRGGVKCHVTVRGGVKSHVTVRGGVKCHVTVRGGVMWPHSSHLGSFASRSAPLLHPSLNVLSSQQLQLAVDGRADVIHPVHL